MSQRLQIVCVLRSGGDYLPEHVHALRDDCLKHMPEHDFICLTDMLGVECTNFPLRHPSWRGWWSKMEIFGPSLEDRPTLFLDLDTVIIGDCRDIMKRVEGIGFVIMRDVYRGRKDKLAMQSSAMFWSRRFEGIYDAFCKDDDAIMGYFRGDQDYLEAVVGGAQYWQDLTLGFCSFKADIVRRGILPKDRIVIFHGRPRPWDQTAIPYQFCRVNKGLVLRKGWVVPGSDTACLQAVLARSSDIDTVILRCARRRTAIQAGGNIGIWPARLAQAFKRCITFEPDEMNFSALKINTGDARNVTAHNAAVGSEESRAGLRRFHGNVGAHQLCKGDSVRVMTIDSLGISDCDLLQLDVEGSEYDALLGAIETIKSGRPVICLELKGLGKRFGRSDQDCVNLVKSMGYMETQRLGRDVVFQHCEVIKDRATQLANMPAHPPVLPDEGCLLVGNGPSVMRRTDGDLIDEFPHVVRFNHFKIRGFERNVGTKTTLWATFGRGLLPADPDIVPDRILFIHDHKGDPAIEAKELWRIPSDFYWSLMKEWTGATGEKNNMLMPSTGFLVASWLIHTGVKKINLIGFDHFSQADSNRHHYWMDRPFKIPKEHDGDFESRMFAKMIESGRAQYGVG